MNFNGIGRFVRVSGSVGGRGPQTRRRLAGLSFGLCAALAMPVSPVRASEGGAFEGITCDPAGVPRGGARLVRVVDHTREARQATQPVDGGSEPGTATDTDADTDPDTAPEGNVPSRRFTVAWSARSGEAIAAADQPVLGGDVRILRCLPDGRWDVVGQGRALRINGTQVEARVEIPVGSAPDDGHGHGSLALALRGNAFPRPMAGDVVVPVRHEVKAMPRVNARRVLDATHLFSGESLSDHGRELLRAEIPRFVRASGRLLVEAHVLRTGDRGQLRRLSRMRADAVAQFLSREMGVDRERVVGLGFGSDGLETGPRDVPLWPAKAIDESIVLRVLPD